MMSFWSSSSTSNNGLVNNLQKTGVIHSPEVIQAMKRTDRANYINTNESNDSMDKAYVDSPQPIGFSQTISAPHMHGYALELGLAGIKVCGSMGQHILDVGAGSGYLTACFGRLIEPYQGKVIGMEVNPDLAEMALHNIQKADKDLIDNGIVDVRCSNGWDGYITEAPFHFIHVGAAADTAPPKLLEQLADGGHMIIPLDDDGHGGQELVEIVRHGSQYSQRNIMKVSYVALVHTGHP